MSKTLIVGEIQNGALREATLELVSFARQLGGDVVSLMIGEGALASYSATGWSQAISKAIEQESPDLILISNTPTGWDVAPKLAAKLDAGLLSDVFQIQEDGGDLVFIRRLFNGKFDARFRIEGSPKIATVQPGAKAAYEGRESGSVETLEVGDFEPRSKFLETRTAPAGGHDLSKAEIIVSGGRGLGKPEEFENTLRPLVNALGGQMGASRPVVDSGWLPHDHQVEVIISAAYTGITLAGPQAGVQVE